MTCQVSCHNVNQKIMISSLYYPKSRVVTSVSHKTKWFWHFWFWIATHSTTDGVLLMICLSLYLVNFYFPEKKLNWYFPVYYIRYLWLSDRRMHMFCLKIHFFRIYWLQRISSTCGIRDDKTGHNVYRCREAIRILFLSYNILESITLMAEVEWKSLRNFTWTDIFVFTDTSMEGNVRVPFKT